MSYRTLIELNHDLCHEIEQHQELFIAEVLSQMRGGGWHKDRSIIGGTFLGMRHHSKEYVVSPHIFILDKKAS